MNRMKKTFLIFLLLSALLLSACGQKTEAMTLPAENEVHRGDVTAADHCSAIQTDDYPVYDGCGQCRACCRAISAGENR